MEPIARRLVMDYYLYENKERLESLGAKNVEECKDEQTQKVILSADLSEEVAKLLIPKGSYCYNRTEKGCIPCPFWDKMPNLPDQSSGFCHYMQEGDFTKDGTFLLWDQCKECGVY